MLCCAVLCCAVLCYAMLCYAICYWHMVLPLGMSCSYPSLSYPIPFFLYVGILLFLTPPPQGFCPASSGVDQLTSLNSCLLSVLVCCGFSRFVDLRVTFKWFATSKVQVMMMMMMMIIITMIIIIEIIIKLTKRAPISIFAIFTSAY